MKEELLIFKVPRGPWAFLPRLIPSLSTLLLILVFVYLGFWQLSRGEEKQKMHSELETRVTLPPLDFSELKRTMQIGRNEEWSKSKTWENISYRQLTVKGIFLNDKQILLDNQIVEGKVGYRVLTPLVVQQDDSKEKPEILLIDRGWIPLGLSRDELPSIIPIEGDVFLIGTLNQPSHGMILKGGEVTKWPLRVQRIDFNTLSSELGHELIPMLLQLNTNDVYGFEVPPITYKISVERHLGYAVQWFTLALATLIYYLVISRRS